MEPIPVVTGRAMGYSVLQTDLRCVYRAVEFDLDLGYDKTILTYHLRYVKLSCVTPSRQFGVPYKIYLGVLGITLQEINMECTCMHCDKVYYNTPKEQSWDLCPTCVVVWFSFNCPIDD